MKIVIEHKNTKREINGVFNICASREDYKASIEAQKKLAEALHEVYNSILSTRISILKDGLNKELKEEKLAHEQRMVELRKKAKEDESLKLYYQDLMTLETAKHQQNLLKIYQEYAAIS